MLLLLANTWVIAGRPIVILTPVVIQAEILIVILIVTVTVILTLVEEIAIETGTHMAATVEIVGIGVTAAARHHREAEDTPPIIEGEGAILEVLPEAVRPHEVVETTMLRPLQRARLPKRIRIGEAVQVLLSAACVLALNVFGLDTCGGRGKVAEIKRKNVSYFHLLSRRTRLVKVQ